MGNLLDNCHFCGHPLVKDSAAIYGPPDREGRCAVTPSCRTCWERILATRLAFHERKPVEPGPGMAVRPAPIPPIGHVASTSSEIEAAGAMKRTLVKRRIKMSLSATEAPCASCSSLDEAGKSGCQVCGGGGTMRVFVGGA